MIEPLFAPTLWLRVLEGGGEATIPPGASRLGGRPDLPEGMPWPVSRGLPMTLLAQLDLAELAPHDGGGRLPPTGWLCCFQLLVPDGVPEPPAGGEPGVRLLYLPEGPLVRLEPPASAPLVILPARRPAVGAGLTLPGALPPRLQARFRGEGLWDGYQDLAAALASEGQVWGPEPEESRPPPEEGWLEWAGRIARGRGRARPVLHQLLGYPDWLDVERMTIDVDGPGENEVTAYSGWELVFQFAPDADLLGWLFRTCLLLPRGHLAERRLGPAEVVQTAV